MNYTGSGWGGRQRGGKQPGRERTASWVAEPVHIADGLRYQHQLTDQLTRLYWPNTYIHKHTYTHPNPPKNPMEKKNHPHMQIKIVLTGKEITTDMKEVLDLINKN